MGNFASEVIGRVVPAGTVGVFFLGQAGFLFKTHAEQLIAVDPYLSDCCERYFGFKRLMAHILEPRELILDQLIVTHAHYDHFDPDSVPILLENGHTELLGAADVLPECERLHLNGNITILRTGDTLTRGDMALSAVPCDHGTMTPDAVGLLMEVDGKRIYIMGDTAFRPDYLEQEKLHGVDLLILPINGAFGNLNETEAAKVTGILQPKLAVPCHYWNFAEHGGNPMRFMEQMKTVSPAVSYRLMRPGEGIIL